MLVLLLISQVFGDWPMWGGEPTHRSVQTLKGAMSDRPVVKWSYGNAGPVEWQFSAICDVNGDGANEIVIGGYRVVYCFNGFTGDTNWVYHTPSLVFTCPTLVDVNGDGYPEVIFGCDDGWVYCLKGPDGDTLWTYNSVAEVRSSPAVADVDGDGQMEVLFGHESSTFFCLNGTNGHLEWAYPTKHVRSCPAVADMDGDGEMEVVIGDYENDTVYCLNGSDGSLAWAYPTGGTIISSASIADVDGDGELEAVIESKDGYVYCINGVDGSLCWKYYIGIQAVSSVSIADVNNDGELEVIAPNGIVYCLKGTDGSLLWSYDAPSVAENPGALVDIDGDNGLEYLVASNQTGDTLTCLNAEDGSVLWQIMLPDGATDIHAPFAGDVDEDGCSEIVLGTNDPGTIWVLDDEDNSSNCGLLYSGLDEKDPGFSIDFRELGKNLYLFLPNQTQISLDLYDASGRLVQNLFNGVLNPGGHTFVPKTTVKGVYLVVLTLDNREKTLKLIR